MTTTPSAAQPPPARTDVLIIGAGPTGLALACALAIRGIPFAIVDQAPNGSSTSRAAVIHARTLEVLDPIGASRKLVDRGLVVPRFVIRDRDRTLLTIPFDTLPTAYPYTLMLPQDITEQVLAGRLADLGHRVYRRHTVTTVVDNGAEVTAGVTGPDHQSRTVRARYVIGCDGMHSVVREQSGIGFSGERYPESFALADVEMDWPLSQEEVHLFFSPRGLVVVAPLPQNRYRLVATMDRAPEHPGIDDVQGLLDTRGPTRPAASVRTVIWGSRFRVHHRLAETYRRGRVFLAGDAAHVHSPAGGQGMNTGIQDAMALAPVLAGALGDSADTADLDAYDATRRPVAAQVIAMTDRLTRAANTRNPFLRPVRNMAFSLAGHIRPVTRRLAMNLSELGTVPRDHTTEPGAPAHRAGHILPSESRNG
jgi:2-polyprenyl-6-methoxyphenol hydroxylase-like FAD-dependent oxidoreductase